MSESLRVLTHEAYWVLSDAYRPSGGSTEADWAFWRIARAASSMGHR